MVRRTRTSALHPCIAVVVAFLAAPFALAAENVAGVIGSRKSGWPQFRGPWRDGVSDETGLLQQWPEGGPKLLWSVSGIGRGYSSPILATSSPILATSSPILATSSPILARGALYVTGDVGKYLVIFAYDLDGKLKWKTTNGEAWRGPWPGSRATCTYDDGRLYHMNAHGRVVCLDPADGTEIWAADVLERFGAKNIKWGISECLLIDGDRVIVTPGGTQALMAALDRKTGETVWASEPLRFQRTHRFGGKPISPPVPDTDRTGYASPVLFELGGRRLISGCSGRHFFCVDADTGKLLWTHPVFARWEVIGAIPVFWRDSVFFTAPDVYGGKLFRVHAGQDGVRFEELWETPVDNCHGALVLVNGRLYGSGYRRLKGWACIDAATGKVRYTKSDLAKGSAIYADGRLYALSEAGVMALLKPTPAGFETVGQFRLAKGRRRDIWSHPVICGGRLYLRYHERLWCHDIRKE